MIIVYSCQLICGIMTFIRSLYPDQTYLDNWYIHLFLISFVLLAQLLEDPKQAND